MAQQLIRAGYVVGPMSIRLDSSVPEGSGLSSSAALEVSCALAMLNGKFAIRVAITNHRSRRDDFDQLVRAVVETGTALR